MTNDAIEIADEMAVEWDAEVLSVVVVFVVVVGSGDSFHLA